MNKQRLEAFTDGVYAIVITLLILDIRIPDVAASALGPALVRLLPQVVTYVLSFFVVGMYWFAHHRVAHQVKLINGTFTWLNLLWLLFVSVMPFPTSLLGRYPLQFIPIAIYGIDLILTNVTGYVITVYLVKHPELAVAPVPPAALRSLLPVYIISNGIYVAGHRGGRDPALGELRAVRGGPRLAHGAVRAEEQSVSHGERDGRRPRRCGPRRAH